MNIFEKEMQSFNNEQVNKNFNIFEKSLLS